MLKTKRPILHFFGIKQQSSNGHLLSLLHILPRQTPTLDSIGGGKTQMTLLVSIVFFWIWQNLCFCRVFCLFFCVLFPPAIFPFLLGKFFDLEKYNNLAPIFAWDKTFCQMLSFFDFFGCHEIVIFGISKPQNLSKMHHKYSYKVKNLQKAKFFQKSDFAHNMDSHEFAQR